MVTNEHSQADSTGEPNNSRGSPTSSDEAQLPVDATLELLADHNRRILLQVLRETADSITTIPTLVGQLTRHEQTEDPPSHTNLRIRLHHIHLPKLADIGVIDFDPRTEEVRYHPNPRLETWLDRIYTEEPALADPR